MDEKQKAIPDEEIERLAALFVRLAIIMFYAIVAIPLLAVAVWVALKIVGVSLG